MWGTALVLALLFASGCSVYMAANQPGKKDLNVLATGTKRVTVIGEIGAPIHSEIQDGKRVDLYVFQQGFSEGTKALRAFGHGLLDVATVGAWELIGTPYEGATRGDEIRVLVTYDDQDRVHKVNYLISNAESGDLPIDRPEDPAAEDGSGASP